MGNKQKISPREKAKLLRRVHRGEISRAQAAREARVGKATILRWLARYEVEGAEGFLPYERNRQYSTEVKLEAVIAYLGGEGSQQEICKKYKIRSAKQLGDWVKVYNAHGDFNSVKHSGGGSYMKQGRETTKEERIEIAKDCLASGKNYGAASFRALYERLIFQNLTYNLEAPCCNEHPIPVLFMMTSNAPDTMYLDMMQNYQQTLSRFVGPTEVLVSGNTLQLKDYSKTDWPWTLFNPEDKIQRHETVFPEECRKAYEMGAALVKQEE